WAPIGGEQTAGGYEVAWKNAAAGLYTVWNVDGNGNYIANAIGAVAATDNTLKTLETSFQQDLNGDGFTGPPPIQTIPIDVSGLTSLTQVGNNYFLYANVTTSGPELKYTTLSPYTTLFRSWAPIGGEQTAGGYEVAWKNAAA